MKKAMIVLGLMTALLIAPEPVIAQDKAETKTGHRETLTVLAYNIYMRPTLLFKDKQMERAKHIVQRLSDSHDVIVFSEAFDDKVRAYLVKNIKGYPYKSRILGRQETIGKQKRLPNLKNGQINGGVLILSRYPIVKERHKIYRASLFPDSLAAKGVLQVSIKKNDRLYHIFGTHLQAGKRSSGGPETRFKQVQDIQSLIAQGDFSKDDVVIVAGDLNMDLFSSQKVAGNKTEAQRMLKTLSQSTPPLKTFESRPVKHLIDYVLCSTKHRRPSIESLEKLLFYGEIDGKAHPLSDHPAVLARFEFPKAERRSKKKRLY